MRQQVLKRTAIGAALAAALAGAYPLLQGPAMTAAHATVATAPTPLASQAPAAAALPDFTGLVATYGPAVVNITVTQKPEKASLQGTPHGIDPAHPFFRRFAPFGMPAPLDPTPARGQGSGFIVSPDGLILTNAHVVDGASEVTVRLTDKREFRAKVVGVDRPTDVAVIKIDGKDLPTVKLGNAADIKVGEWVVAIGSPYGFENTVTSGIVSAKARTLPDETYVPFLQTDVAVNPGNSGGPLFNLRGEVVGMNSRIYSRAGGYQGLSFAVPIDIAVQVQDQLVKHGKVTRGQLGVTIQDVNQALADSFGLKQPGGALVSSVAKDSPAAKAGIEPGDVITRYGDTRITSSSHLPPLVAATSPGERVEIEVARKGDTRKVRVAVGELKGAKVASAAVPGADQGKLGVGVRPLAADEQRALGLDAGLVVEQVSGPAARAGLQPGDVILSLNGTPVTSADQLKELLSASGKHIAVLVQRDGMKTFVPIEIG